MKNETKNFLKDLLRAILIIIALILAIHLFSTPHTIPITEEPEYIPYKLPVTEAYGNFLD